MRQVRVYKPTIDPKSGRRNGKEFRCLAVFHQFSTWGDESETSPCAIVEFEDGTVESIELGMIRFSIPARGEE